MDNLPVGGAVSETLGRAFDGLFGVASGHACAFVPGCGRVVAFVAERAGVKPAPGGGPWFLPFAFLASPFSPGFFLAFLFSCPAACIWIQVFAYELGISTETPVNTA